MDMQGTPIGTTHQGTKNTTDAEGRKHPITEGAGAVASDSLAAESVRAGGDFASNRDAAPLGVKGGNSTLANEDTSGAVKLDAAPDKASRRDEGLDERVKYPEGAGGQGEYSGAHSKLGYVGGSKSGERKEEGATSSTGDKQGAASSTGDKQGAKASTGDKEGVKASTGGEAGSEAKGHGTTGGTGGSASVGGGDAGGRTDVHQVDTAPSYVHVAHAAGGKPKGKNLTEGGFDDDDVSKNASFNSDIGDENDPGRAAENKFARENAESGADAGGGPRQKGVSGDGQYDVLETDQEP